jgi:hypothetical protein
MDNPSYPPLGKGGCLPDGRQGGFESYLLIKEYIIEKTYSFENLPPPLFACLRTG